MGRLKVYGPIDRNQLMPRILAMTAKGYTQEAIAVEVRVAQSTVQKWLWAERMKNKEKIPCRSLAS